MNKALCATVTSWLVSTFTGGDPKTIIQALLAEKRTGQLTIHISQGGVGSIEWKERGSSLTAGSGGIKEKPLDRGVKLPVPSTM